MKGVGVSALVVVVALAAASPGLGAGSSASVAPAQLALMPLPKADLGADVAGLPLAQDSGIVTNLDATHTTAEAVQSSRFAKLGRLTGYTLDYGSSLPTGAGVTEAQTTVELYRSAADATNGLAFWRHDDGYVSLVEAAGIGVHFARFVPVGIGPASFGDVGSISMRGEPTLYGSDVDFQVGSVLGLVSISAVDRSLVQPLALAAARKLRARIAAVLAGRIAGRPLALPAQAKPGPPPGGPSLAAVALARADLGSGDSVAHQGYLVDPTMHALSSYVRVILLSGDVGYVQEEVAYYGSAGQASYELALRGDFDASPKAWRSQVGSGDALSAYAPRTVSVNAGDGGSRAVLGLAKLADGRSLYLGIVLLRVGRTIEYITMATSAPVKLLPTAIVAIAAVAARRAESALTGAVAPATTAPATTTAPAATTAPATTTPAPPVPLPKKTKPKQILPIA